MVENKFFSKYIAASFSNYDIKVYSIAKGLEVVSKFGMKAIIESLAFNSFDEESYILYAGGQFGKCARWLIHKGSGEVAEMMDGVVGEKIVKFTKVTVLGKPAIFRISPEPEITYELDGKVKTSALSLPTIEVCT